MRKTLHLCVALVMAVALTGCHDDDDDKDVVIDRQAESTIGKLTTVSATVHKDGTWQLVSSPDTMCVMQQSDGQTALLLGMTAGQYVLRYTADGAEETVTVTMSPAELSPYIAHVLDYRPAPGQFINAVPKWEEGTTYAEVLADVEARLVGKEQGSEISLGAYGGYIDLAFDHTILNKPGVRDLRVLGNAFYSDQVERLDGYLTGNSEPGIVMVALDKNGNGRPDDDEWYEIAGSEHGSNKLIKGYSLTYSRPTTEENDADYKAGREYLTIKQYIKWSDNQGGEGYLQKNSFHVQSYFPGWLSGNTMTVSGTRLPDNAVDTRGDGTYYVRYCYEWGYADSMPNTHEGSAIDIDWAVDAQGNKVHLIGADFVRVYTGVNQSCGWVGETSTEVCGAVDLHVQ